MTTPAHCLLRFPAAALGGIAVEAGCLWNRADWMRQAGWTWWSRVLGRRELQGWRPAPSARSAGQLGLRALGNLRGVGGYPAYPCSEGQGIWSIYHHHRGEGCVVNISPPVFLTYSPPRGRRNPRGRVTAGMQVKHWQCHIAFPFLLCMDLFVFPWTGNDLLKMYFIHPPTWSWFFLFYSPDLVNDIDSFSNVKLTLLPRTNPTVSDGWSFLYTANIHLYIISIYDLK